MGEERQKLNGCMLWSVGNRETSSQSAVKSSASTSLNSYALDCVLASLPPYGLMSIRGYRFPTDSNTSSFFQYSCPKGGNPM